MITSQYIHKSTRFKGLKGIKCLCGASELSVKKIGAWNQQVGHPWYKQYYKVSRWFCGPFL